MDLAFPMEYDKENKLKFVPGSDKVCITFMAKNEKSNLRFFLNAPFGCTPARDTVNKEDIRSENVPVLQYTDRREEVLRYVLCLS